MHYRIGFSASQGPRAPFTPDISWANTRLRYLGTCNRWEVIRTPPRVTIVTFDLFLEFPIPNGFPLSVPHIRIFQPNFPIRLVPASWCWSAGFNVVPGKLRPVRPDLDTVCTVHVPTHICETRFLAERSLKLVPFSQMSSRSYYCSYVNPAHQQQIQPLDQGRNICNNLSYIQ